MPLRAVTDQDIKPILNNARPPTPTLSQLKTSFPTTTHPTLNSYFSPISPASTLANPSGILLNKSTTTKQPSTSQLPTTSSESDQIPTPPIDVITSALDGDVSDATTSGYTSSTGAVDPSTAPSSTVGSPPLIAMGPLDGSSRPDRKDRGAPQPRAASPSDSIATLESLATTLRLQDGQPGAGGGRDAPRGTDTPLESPSLQQQAFGSDKQGSRNTSPHCHFAPLPKVELEAGALTRRNSVALSGSVRSKTSAPEELVSVTAVPSSLGSGPSGPSPPVLARRPSRSASPSPSASRPPASSSASSSRTHSPTISRRPSSDALSLHFIEKAKSKPSARVIVGGGSASRERERVERERTSSFSEPETTTTMGISNRSREGPLPLPSALVASSRGSLPSSPILSTSSAAFASTSIAPSLERTASQRRAIFVEPPMEERNSRSSSISTGNRRRSIDGRAEDVVLIQPVAERGREPATFSFEEDEDEGNEEEEEEEDGDSDEENSEDEERDKEDEDEDEEDAAIGIERKTSQAGASEIIRWHSEKKS